MSATYEVFVERDGIRVQVQVEFSDDAMHRDADETAELAGSDAGRLLNRLVDNKARAEMPF